MRDMPNWEALNSWLDSIGSAPFAFLASAIAAVLFVTVICSPSRLQQTVSAIAMLALISVGILWLQDHTSNHLESAAQTRVTLWRGQAVVQPVLACLVAETDETIDAACEKVLFSRPEYLAAAMNYLSEGMVLLKNSYPPSGARAAIAVELDSVRSILQRDKFGVLANLLLTHERCSVQSCDSFQLFSDLTRIRDNMAGRVFQKRIAQYSEYARNPATPVVAPAANQLAATAPPTLPLDPRYVLPSSNSIPPISIMNEEESPGAAPVSRRAPQVVPAATPPKQAPARPKSAQTNSSELRPLVLSQ